MYKYLSSFMTALCLWLPASHGDAAKPASNILDLSQCGAATSVAAVKEFLGKNQNNAAVVNVPAGDYALNSIVIPANVSLVFEHGGRLVVKPGERLEINGAIDAGRFQIFAGEGVVCGNPRITAVPPEWFGAGAVSGEDDSRPLQQALDLACSNITVDTDANWGDRSLPVDLGSGVFFLSRGVKADSFVQIVGNNATLKALPGFPEKEFALDISLRQGMPWNIACSVLVEGVQFGGFSNGVKICTNNADRSSIIIRRCKFARIGQRFYKNDLANREYCSPMFEYGAAIRLDSQSSLNLISDCVFSDNHRVLYMTHGDYVVMASCWITTRPIVQGKDVKALRYSPIVNRMGYLVLRDCMGIPGNKGDANNFKWWNPPVYANGDDYPGHPEPYGDPSILWANQAENAWIANYASLLCDNVRFGGEYGGFCAVNNFAAGEKGCSRFITINNSMMRHESNEPSIRLYAIPDHITMRDNNHLELYMAGKFKWEGKERVYKLRLLDFAPSLTEDEIKALVASSSTSRLFLENNQPERRLGRSWRAEDLIPPQLNPNLVDK